MLRRSASLEKTEKDVRTDTAKTADGIDRVGRMNMTWEKSWYRIRLGTGWKKIALDGLALHTFDVVVDIILIGRIWTVGKEDGPKPRRLGELVANMVQLAVHIAGRREMKMGNSMPLGKCHRMMATQKERTQKHKW